MLPVLPPGLTKRLHLVWVPLNKHIRKLQGVELLASDDIFGNSLKELPN